MASSMKSKLMTIPRNNLIVFCPHWNVQRGYFSANNTRHTSEHVYCGGRQQQHDRRDDMPEIIPKVILTRCQPMTEGNQDSGSTKV